MGMRAEFVGPPPLPGSDEAAGGQGLADRRHAHLSGERHKKLRVDLSTVAVMSLTFVRGGAFPLVPEAAQDALTAPPGESQWRVASGTCHPHRRPPRFAATSHPDDPTS